MAKPMKPVAQIASINASLTLVLLDAELANAWEPMDAEPDGDDVGGHPQRVIELVSNDEVRHGALDVGAGKALVVTLEGASGMADVYKLADGTLAFVEPPRDWWEDEDNYGAKATEIGKLFDDALGGSAKTTPIGKLSVGSGRLVAFDSNVDLAPVARLAKKLGAGDIKGFGDDDDGVVAAIAPGTYAVSRFETTPKWAEDQPFVVAYVRSA